MKRAALLLSLVLLATLDVAVAQKKAARPVPAAPQVNDEGYTKKIREYTTESFFLTELVDHLPASAAVPSPEKVLGYPIGTPERLTYSKDIYRYMRELAKATPLVRVFKASEKKTPD